MNTANSNFLRPPVGQLDKTPIIQLKASKNVALEVGRHENKTSHTSAQAYTPDLEELTAMKYMNKLLTGLLPDMKVCFHNTLYVEQIQEGFLPDESDIFLQFVKTFALFRHTDRVEPLTNVILTNENDFYNAFKLMQKRKLSDYQDIKPKNKNKILDLIKLKFQNRTFTPQIIAKELFYNYAFIHRILALLILEREIEFVKTIEGQKSFRLREKPIVHVVESLDTQINQVNHVVSW